MDILFAKNHLTGRGVCAFLANKYKLDDEIIDDFVAFNIVGIVECADVDASKSIPLADVKYFQSLRIDPSKAKGLDVFRLAESRGDIIISEKICLHSDD